MALAGVLSGLWFAAMGLWAMAHADHGATEAAGHWMAFPSGRRIGGAVTVALGLGVAAGSIAWL